MALYGDRLLGFAKLAVVIVALSACTPSRMPPSSQAGAFDPPNPMLAAPRSPPPKRGEIPPPAPSPEVLWHSGHWSWDGAKYIWTAGHYVERPSPSANWLPGYWEETPGGWIWVDGQWTS
jgi:WXXGXW repeat (2 copies)